MATFDNRHAVGRLGTGKRRKATPRPSSSHGIDPQFGSGRTTPMKSNLHSELSATSRVRMAVPPRTQSAKGRIEGTKKREVSDYRYGDKDSEFAKSKQSLRRPSTGVSRSAASSRSNFPRPSQAWQSQKRNDQKEVRHTESIKERDSVSDKVFRMIKLLKGPQKKQPECKISGETVSRPSAIPTTTFKMPSPREKKKKKGITFCETLKVCGDSNSAESWASKIGCFMPDTFKVLEDVTDHSKSWCENKYITKTRQDVCEKQYKKSALRKSDGRTTQNTRLKIVNSNKGAGKKCNIKPVTYHFEVEGEEDDRENISDMEDNFPYKLKKHDVSPVECSDLELPEVEEVCISHLGREMPCSLGPLRDFVFVPEVDIDCEKLKYLTGVDPKDCLIFLPGLDFYDVESLPEVPSIQHVDDDLPYRQKIISPRPWLPKKYPQVFKPIPVPEGRRSHTAVARRSTGVTGRRRMIEAVRRECIQLENALKDIEIGDSSVIGMFKADVTKLHSTLADTLASIPERCRPAVKISETESDQFGINEFYKEHDRIIENIRREHARCVRELAVLEEDANIEESERHFSRMQVAVVDSDKIPQSSYA